MIRHLLFPLLNSSFSYFCLINGLILLICMHWKFHMEQGLLDCKHQINCLFLKIGLCYWLSKQWKIHLEYRQICIIVFVCAWFVCMPWNFLPFVSDIGCYLDCLAVNSLLVLCLLFSNPRDFAVTTAVCACAHAVLDSSKRELVFCSVNRANVLWSWASIQIRSWESTSTTCVGRWLNLWLLAPVLGITSS